jgi:hypothetical protein
LSKGYTLLPGYIQRLKLPLENISKNLIYIWESRIVYSISSTSTEIVASELLYKSSSLAETVKIIGKGRVTESLIC